jgi:hypothetical protein
MMIAADDIAQVSADGLLRFRGQILRCALGSGGISAQKIGRAHV